MLSASDCLNASGCSASSVAERRLEVPGAQGPEGVVGLGAGPGARRRPTPNSRRRRRDDPGDLGVDLEGAAEVGRERDPQPGQRRRRPAAANAMPGSPSACGARGSGPAITESSSARSPTLRAIGPPTEVVSHWLYSGHCGTRPRLGRSPTTPQNDAGLRSEPPMSEPSASGTMPDASAHAAPPRRAAGRAGRVDRVERRAEDRVERVRPGRELRHVGLADHRHAGPADPLDDQVVAVGDVVARRAASRTSSASPATAWVSLNANGSPCSGPTSAPRGERLVGGRAPLAGPLLVERDDRVELGVALGDPGQVQVEQLAGGDRPCVADGGGLVARGRSRR